MNYIMSCSNSQVQKLVSDMTSTCQHLLMSANICQRLPAPTSWCPHATHITCAELEFWLEVFLHATNPQAEKQHNRYPSSAQLRQHTSQAIATSKPSETTCKPRKTTFKPHTPTSSITAELEFSHGHHTTPGGPSRNNAAQPLLQLSIQATTSNQGAIEGAIKAIRTINDCGAEKS